MHGPFGLLYFEAASKINSRSAGQPCLNFIANTIERVESSVELVVVANVHAPCRDLKRSVLHYARPLSGRL